MKVLVTGGAGFIGSNLVELLITKGYTVTVVDNLHTGSRENLKGLDITFIQKNCGDVSIKEISDIDGIFHLGIYSSSPMYKKNPSLVGKAVNDFLHMLSLSGELDVKMVWASTSSVYNGNETPWREGMPIFVKDYYAEARYYMERLAALHYEWFKTKSIGLRLFSVYGPKEKPKGEYANLASQFLWWMQKGESPVVYGDGEQRRDFVFVDDILKGFLLAFDSRIECDIINLGTGVSYSLNELVDIINDVLKTDIPPTYTENVIKGYVYETLADTAKAKEVLGFESTVNLREGINYLCNKVG
jgi:UDP-glucose 4-epimerase